MHWDHLSTQDFIVAVALSILILVTHAYFHVRKIGSNFLIFRTLLLTIGLIGLFILFAKPKVIDTEPAKNVILHTGNLVEINPEGNYQNKIQVVQSVHDVLSSTINYDTIIITGDGLTESDLSLLDSFNLKYETPPKRNGFVSINIPTAKENEQWLLTGKINQSQSAKIKLTTSRGEVLETNTDSEGNFSINGTSSIAGKFTYKLTAQYQDTSIIESFPFEVLPSQKWNLLAISSSPSFELNYLKNYWVKLGNGFSLRQKVSTERFKETFINTPKVVLDKLSRTTLSKFNFLLIDSKSWNDLKDPIQSTVLNQVAAGRIGLLFFGLEKGDVIKKIKNLKIDSEEEIQFNESNLKLSQLNTPRGYKNIRTKNLISAATRDYGLGTIGLMTTSDTYKLILANEDNLYQNIWAAIFSDLYMAPSENIIFKSPLWAWENEDVDINIYTRTEISDKAVLNSEIELPIISTPGQTGMHKVSIKPETGWNTLKEETTQKTHKFFIHPKDSWQAMKQEHIHNINQNAASSIRNIEPKENQIEQDLTFYWGLLISLLGFACLWIHERFYT